MKSRIVQLSIALAILAASGIVHGMWSNRWSDSANNSGKNLLESLPAATGGFVAGEFVKIDPAELPPNTRCDSRRFTPMRGNKGIMVSLTSGSPGAVAVHTPDVCFLGAGWKLRGAVARQTIPVKDGNASFWTADFVKTSATGSEAIRVRWAWTADGAWQAPDYPRWVFARAPLLYKLYVVHPLADDDDLSRDDPYKQFVSELAPQLSQQIR